MHSTADVDLCLDARVDADTLHELEAKLLASLQQDAGVADYLPLAVIARDRNGTMLGGLAGSTSYGWLLVKMLWVAEDARRRGLGALLMQKAEAEAVRRGCHAAWLDTSNARARRFYEKLGYRVFGTLQNVGDERPEGHSRHFLCKRIANG
jgi:ribosomal protein S18 acetylase RimI-like enzyme